MASTEFFKFFPLVPVLSRLNGIQHSADLQSMPRAARLRRRVHIILAHTLFLSTIVGIVGRIIVDADSLSQLTNLVVVLGVTALPYSFLCSAHIKHTYVKTFIVQVRENMDGLLEDEMMTGEQKVILKTAAAVVRFLGIGISGSSCVLVAAIVLVPLGLRISNPLSTVLPAPVRPELCDLRDSVCFGAHWVVELVMYNCTWCTYTAITTMHIGGAIYLRAMLIVLHNAVTQRGASEQELARLIHTHQRILDLAILHSECFSSDFQFRQCWGVAFTALSALQVVQNPRDSVAALMIIAFVALNESIIAFWGEELREKSASIQDAAYNCDWLKASRWVRLDLSVMIARAQRKVGVRAGIFGYLSFGTLLSQFNSAYSYLSVLLNVVD